MGRSIRFYIFEEDGTLRHLPQRVLEGLIHGQDALPQYAGTRQRLAEVIVENEDGTAKRILRVDGSYLHLGPDGHFDEEKRGAALTLLELAGCDQKPDTGGTVVNLAPKLKRQKWEREHRWQPSVADMDRLATAILREPVGKANEIAPILDGAAPKAPPVPHAARDVLSEFGHKLFEIRMKLDKLSEPALKGLAYEARSRAEDVPEDAAYFRALADDCDRRREIKARHRTGKGVWYAVVEVIRWEEEKRRGEAVASYEERCSGHKAAAEAARRLLQEHAHRFDENITVDAELFTDLEWGERD